MDTSKAAAVLGRKGGKAGTGEAKRRGNGDYYRALRAKRRGLPREAYCSKCGEWGEVAWGDPSTALCANCFKS